MKYAIAIYADNKGTRLPHDLIAATAPLYTREQAEEMVGMLERVFNAGAKRRYQARSSVTAPDPALTKA